MESLTQPNSSSLQQPISQGLGQPMQAPMQAPMHQGVPQGMPQPQGVQLKDIHLPEQINDFPVALGWWILAATIIALIVLSLMKYFAQRKRNKDKKTAIAQLKNNPSVGDTIKILKWAAMQYYPRSQTAHLFGEQFQAFLSSQMKDKHQAQFNTLSQAGFDHLYQKDNINSVDDKFNQASLLWLNKALPPHKHSAQGVI